MATGNVSGQETLSVPASREIEKLRTPAVDAEEAACTIYSVQAVAGVATAGCARAGVDYGRRP